MNDINSQLTNCESVQFLILLTRETKKVEEKETKNLKPNAISAQASDRPNLAEASKVPNAVIDNRRESKEKEARSFLRDEFLGILFTITNQPVKIQFDKTKEPLNATFAGSDFTFSTISVKDFKTSLGREPHSLLRTSDITSINYEVDM